MGIQKLIYVNSIHFYCEDLETTLQKVIEKGGSIVIPITKIEAEGKGHFAVFADSEGNHVGLYKDLFEIPVIYLKKNHF